MDAGTALGTVTIGVLDAGRHPGCEVQDATFDAMARITPQTTTSYIGGIRALGWSLTAVACLTAVFFAVWVTINRKERAVAAMQPLFLVTVCVGVFIMALTILPLSVDEQIASKRGCDFACASIPWLISTGFSITFSALFSKLWRINRLFNAPRFQRLKVEEKDVLLPFAVMFTLNLVILVSWTIIDPFQWSRQSVKGEPWNMYGVCEISGSAGFIFMSLAAVINLGALCLACYQAFKARTISDDFSESKSMALAIYSWLQLCISGLPVLLLISKDNQAAKYFVVVLLVFAVCMSMLLFIFVPLVLPKNAGGNSKRTDPASQVTHSSAQPSSQIP
jgi:gamma-aminobutyric acid type B receptor